MAQTPSDIELLILDVDGVLTDGSIWYDDAGQELKRFHVRDGAGMRAWMRMGFHVAIITGRDGTAVMHRMRNLGVEHVLRGVKDKRHATQDLCQRLGVRPSRAACVADDWADLGMMGVVGFAIAVADADESVRERAAWVTTRPGGQGAVREAIEHLLRAKGLLDKAREGA